MAADGGAAFDREGGRTEEPRNVWRGCLRRERDRDSQSTSKRENMRYEYEIFDVSMCCCVLICCVLCDLFGPLAGGPCVFMTMRGATADKEEGENNANET